MPDRTRNRRRVSYLCYCVAALYGTSAAAASALGGYCLSIGSVQLESRRPFRDFVIALVVGAVGAGLDGRLTFAGFAPRALGAIRRLAPWATAAVALAVTIVGVTRGTHCACGADAYGYVSQARLWLSGHLHLAEPLMATLTWPNREWTLAPLGYRPATSFGSIVPSYSPGLPMLMAATVAILRAPQAVFLVVPLLAALVVGATFAFGRRLDGTTTGMLGALLVAASPTFLFQLVQPMSDVPVTGLWIAAAVCVVGESAWSAALAGAVGSMAVLTRPNLVPLMAILGGYFLLQIVRRQPGAVRRCAWFVATGVAGPIAAALIQQDLYGSPMLSGYGQLSGLYAATFFWTNVRQFAAWLWQTHGPLMFVGLTSPVWLPFAARGAPPGTKDMLWLGAVFSYGVVLSYLFYIPFDNWTFTRFLLPAYPFLCLLAVWPLVRLSRRANALVELTVVLVLIVAAHHWYAVAADLGFMTNYKGERRYIEAARMIAATTPPGEWVLAMQHSGSVRYYGNRKTFRYDWLNDGWLDRFVAVSRERGTGPVIVLDDWEEPQFRQRFKGDEYGALDWPARFEFDTQPKVRIYDPADRERYRRGLTPPTRRIHVWDDPWGLWP